MSDQKRAYVKRKRAEVEAATRLRITETAVALHGSVGPSRTSVSAIAEHAGVRRSTVYRHFADEEAVFAACSAHWSAANPQPDLEAWARIPDPDDRLIAGLTELYGFYDRGEQMIANLIRDAPLVPAVQKRFGRFPDYLRAAAETLASGRAPDPALPAALGHAVAFTTWRSLVREQGLPTDRAVALIRRLIATDR